jgi:hypothetical protein
MTTSRSEVLSPQLTIEIIQRQLLWQCLLRKIAWHDTHDHSRGSEYVTAFRIALVSPALR